MITTVLVLQLIFPVAVLGDQGTNEDIPTRGDHLYVGPGNYSTIQSAIDAASDEDQIHVSPGVYYESIWINKSVHLKGSGQNKTFIVGNEFGVRIQHNRSSVGFFTINCTSENSIGVHIGGENGAGYAFIQVAYCNVSSNRIGIFAQNITSGLYIEHNIVNSTKTDVLLKDTYLFWIQWNELYGINTIELKRSSNTLIRGNLIETNGVGLIISDSYSSNFVGVHTWNNTFNNCSIGISINNLLIERSITSWWDKFNMNGVGFQIRRIENLKVENSTFYKCDVGTIIDNTTELKIKNSQYKGNILGIKLKSCDDGEVVLNQFIENELTALSVLNTNDISVYDNDFILNNQDGYRQVFSNSVNDQWDNGEDSGNYWSDWSAPDYDMNGIVDLPYFVEDPLDNILQINDSYPLTDPVKSIRIYSPPSIEGTNVLAATEDMGYSVDYDVTSSDTSYWSLNTDASFLSLGLRTGILSGMPSNDDVGIHYVNVTASDSKNLDFRNFTLTVQNVNDAPYITRLSPWTEGQTTWTWNEDVSLNIPFKGTDIDPTNDELTWKMDEDTSFLEMISNGTRGEFLNITGTPGNDDVGTHNVTISLSDGNGGNVSETFTLIIENINDEPVISTTDITTGRRYVAYSVDYDASDIDPTNDTLTWSMLTNATFLSLNSASGFLNGTPTKHGSFWVNISVSDGNGGYDHHNFTLTVDQNNTTPESSGAISSVEMDEDTDSETIDLRTLIIDPDGDELEFEVEAGPHVYAHIDSGYLVILTSEENWAGESIVTIKATDGFDTYTLILPVAVSNKNDPPEILDLVVPVSFMEGNMTLITSDVIDPDIIYGDIISYSWTIVGIGEVGNEKDLYLNLTEGTYDLTLEVEDAYGAKVERSVNIQVEGRPPQFEEDDEPPYLLITLISIAVITAIILVLLLAFILRRRNREENYSSRNGRPSNGREESLWNIIDEGDEPEFADAFENILYNENGFRTSVGRIRDKIETDHLSDRLDEDEYDELIGILDDIEG